MQTTKSPGGYLLIEYEPADVEDLNASLGTDFSPHSGGVLFTRGGNVAWRCSYGNDAPLLLAWELRRLALQEGSQP